MRVRRQSGLGQVDAPAIEELAAGRDGDEHRRVAVLDDADGSSLRWFSRHERADQVCLRMRSRERAHWKAIVPNPKKHTPTSDQLQRSRALTRTSKRYAKTRLASAQATFTVGDDNPLNGGDANGVCNGWPDTPAIKWGS